MATTLLNSSINFPYEYCVTCAEYGKTSHVHALVVARDHSLFFRSCFTLSFQRDRRINPRTLRCVAHFKHQRRCIACYRHGRCDTCLSSSACTSYAGTPSTPSVAENETKINANTSRRISRPFGQTTRQRALQQYHRVVSQKWLAETGDILPWQKQPLDSVRYLLTIVSEYRPSRSERLKLHLENYCGQEWYWPPFSRPQPPVRPLKKRVRWKDGDGCLHWADVSPDLAADMIRIASSWKDVMAAAASAEPDQTADPARGGTRTNTAGASSIGSASTLGKQSLLRPNGSRSSSTRLSTEQWYFSQSSDQILPNELYVLLCVPNGNGRYLPAEIRLASCKLPSTSFVSDGAFVATVKAHCKRLRGVWRNVFGFMVLSHCSCTQFDTWIKRGRVIAGFIKDELPPPNNPDYEYSPKPPPDPTRDPVSIGNWRDRFAANVSDESLYDVEIIQKVPKRTGPFHIASGLRSKEPVWGLRAVYMPGALRILIYHIIVTSIGLIFYLWHLAHGSADRNDVLIPFTIIGTFMSLFWASMNRAASAM